MLSPACEAVNVQVPEASMVTVDPDTEHVPEVFDASDTVKPDEAVGAKVKGVENARSAGLANVIVWLALLTLTVMVTVPPET